MTTHSIAYKNITKSYGDVVVLNDISLQIKDHVTTALVGKSGSGKTTLLQLVNGLVKPNKGVIEVFGSAINYNALPALRKQMGYVVQGAGLFPHMTVYENITIMAKLHGWDVAVIHDRAIFVSELVDLKKDLFDRYPHNLSGGQQQRVSLCRALMLNPPLLLLDEPFSALDPITKSYIHDEFFKLQKAESRSILLVTHDMEEAVKLADNIIVIERGRIVQQGKTEALINSPNNEYVEELLQGVTP